jgi:hypothetical protein
MEWEEDEPYELIAQKNGGNSADWEAWVCCQAMPESERVIKHLGTKIVETALCLHHSDYLQIASSRVESLLSDRRSCRRAGKRHRGIEIGGALCSQIQQEREQVVQK